MRALEVLDDAIAHVAVALEMLKRRVEVDRYPDFSTIRALVDLADARVSLVLARCDINLRQEKESRSATLAT